MFEIRGRDIYLTRGDTAHLTIDIRNEVTGTDYEMQPEDTLYLTVRRQPSPTSPTLVSKKVVGGRDINLAPEDTAEMLAGSYVYDVELRSGADVYTIIQCSAFNLLPEVTTQ